MEAEPKTKPTLEEVPHPGKRFIIHVGAAAYIGWLTERSRKPIEDFIIEDENCNAAVTAMLADLDDYPVESQKYQDAHEEGSATFEIYKDRLVSPI